MYSVAPYTGAAGWLHSASVETIMGLHMQGNELWLPPCLPTRWPRAELTLQRKGRIMRFVWVRGDAQATLAELCDQQANEQEQQEQKAQDQEQPGQPKPNTGAQDHIGGNTQLLKVGQRIHWPDVTPRM